MRKPAGASRRSKRPRCALGTRNSCTSFECTHCGLCGLDAAGTVRHIGTQAALVSNTAHRLSEPLNSGARKDNAWMSSCETQLSRQRLPKSKSCEGGQGQRALQFMVVCWLLMMLIQTQLHRRLSMTATGESGVKASNNIYHANDKLQKEQVTR